MARRRKDRDKISPLGFGLNVQGGRENPFQLRDVSKTPSRSKPQEQVDVPASGPGREMAERAVPIQFPLNFYPPERSESVDLSRLINVPAGTTRALLLEFQAQEAQTVIFYRYGIFTDALDADLVQFFPTINNKRVLRYHGDPQNDYRLSLSLGPNLNEANMKPCQLFLKPGDTLQWHVTNNDAVDAPMGVRMTGYVDVSKKRTTFPFGG